MSELMDRWAYALPHFALAGDRMVAALRGAATAYGAADAAVGDAARKSEGS